jgi:hypothetical protein
MSEATLETTLAKDMMARANKDGLPQKHILRKYALAFDKAAKGYHSDIQTCSTKELLSTWAKARRVWCNYTGESLI